jgi:hypothetical protein
MSDKNITRLEKIFIVCDEVFVNSKRVALNLNEYRNAHYQTLNKAKKIFKQMLYDDYPELFRIKASRMVVTYCITPLTAKKFDTMNILSIVDKFFLDAVKEAGAIPDDSYDIVSYGAPVVLPYVKPDKKQPALKTDKNRQIVINCAFFL